MTDIEALRARMREAINALAAALAALKDGEPEGPRRDGLIAGIEHALNNAKPLDAEITRLREDLDRVTRERDGFSASLQQLSGYIELAKERREAAEAALAKRDEEVARLWDKVEGLSADLTEAVRIAYKYGAATWVQMNYPKQHATLTQEPTP